MYQTSEECFAVYIRDDTAPPALSKERKLVTCCSYEEALMVRRENERPDRHCIIRFEGDTGGGD